MCEYSGVFNKNFSKLEFRNRIFLKMKGNRTGVFKVHCKLSGKRRRGKTNVRTIFLWYKPSKAFKTLFKKTNTPYTRKQPLMMAYEGSESVWGNFRRFIYQFQPETKTLIRKIERILNKSYRQNLFLLFNETCLNERQLPNYTHTHTHTRTHKYICIIVGRSCLFNLGMANRLEGKLRI